MGRAYFLFVLLLSAGRAAQAEPLPLERTVVGGLTVGHLSTVFNAYLPGWTAVIESANMTLGERSSDGALSTRERWPVYAGEVEARLEGDGHAGVVRCRVSVAFLPPPESDFVNVDYCRPISGDKLEVQAFFGGLNPNARNRIRTLR